MKYCTNCGNKLDDNAKFCTGCGNKMPDAATESIRKTTEIVPEGIIPVVPIDLSGRMRKEKKKSKTGLIIAVVLVIIVLLAAAAVVVGNLFFDFDFFPFNLQFLKPTEITGF